MRLLVLVLLCLWPVVGAAEMGSLLGGAAFEQGRASLLKSTGVPKAGSSLFAGTAKGSFFAPFPARMVRAPVPQAQIVPSSAVMRLRHIIGRAESPRAGYDAVQHGARIKPRKPPTHMTIGEIYNWIAATPGQPHAIGRYQFIPATLRRVVAKTGARRSDYFTPDLQDRLADVLLEDAGFSKFMSGRMGRSQFMNNLAGIWAGLPTTSGQSKYHGYAGNRATISLAYFRSEMSKIGPS